jgi:endonuclease/exonuclease/phosphatase family metal-dependent hydrolase
MFPFSQKDSPLKSDPREELNLPMLQSRNVGELGAKWRFPSDHLPVGADLYFGEDRLRCVSWNMLNTEHLHYIESNSQGLLGSLITELHVPSAEGLTQRDEILLKEVLFMLAGGVDVLCLQECSTLFAKALVTRIGTLEGRSFGVAPEADSPKRDEGLIVFNKARVELAVEGLEISRYTRGNFIFKAQFRFGTKLFSLVTTHIPGGPEGGSARAELARALRERGEFHVPCLLCGDMNAEPHVLNEAFAQHGLTALVPVLPGYPSHVNTQRQSVIFDMFFFSPGKDTSVNVLPIARASELLPGAAAAAALL